MQISKWLWGWLEMRQQRRAPQTPLDYAARLSLRRLEERQVLSVSAAIVTGGVLDVQVTGTDTVTVSVDSANNRLVLHSADTNSDIYEDLSLFSSINITGDTNAVDATVQTVSFAGSEALDLTGSLSILVSAAGNGIEHVNFATDVDVQGSISIVAEDLSITSGGVIGEGITFDLNSDFAIASGASLTSTIDGISIFADNIDLQGTVSAIGQTVVIK
eukprot:TRINITY_DN23855_c0_g1_i4.p1 TRINITY_DN23855_c0_g1~~TRINITY_DN23855_c0_g1_i4.p1  ORF type:complete len:217 (-),score=4.55 TRINITY_DN23855_c0_g1_i4:88-738(-)